MIQHIYDSDQTIYLSSPITDLMYHVNVFAAADKYDVPSLRVLVVNKFTVLMGKKWSSSQQEFCMVIQHLCGPNAASYADPSLQKAAAAFCFKNILSLTKLDAFVTMLEACGPFAARLLATFLKDKNVIHSLRCQRCIPASENRHQQLASGRCSMCDKPPYTNRLGVTEKLQSYSIMEL
jgi:hypothetical protein